MFRGVFLLVGLFVALLLILPENLTLADGPNIKWAPPNRIPGYPANTESPYLVADQNRVVHAFHSQSVNGTISIVYSQWNYEHGWTNPVDILLPPRGEALVKGTWLDSKGIIHLILTSGNDQIGGGIYYSKASASEAGNARAWSMPKLIGRNANMFAAAMAADDRGNMYVFYGGNSDGNGLYEVRSRDGGDTWSEPIPIFLTNEDGMLPGSVALLLDGNGNLHIAWSVWRPPYGALDLYYARLNVNSNQTTRPVLLYGGGGDTPALMEYNNTLLLVYATGGIAQNGQAGKAMQQSTDGGKTWTSASWAFPPLVGGNGGAALVRDSSNNLYAFLGNRTGDCCHGLWYSAWEGNHWNEPQAIVQGPKTLDFDPFSPQAVISQGNVILVTWWNESKVNGVWYSYAKVDAPELPPVPLPTTAPIPVPTAITPTDIVTTVKPVPTKLPVETIPIYAAAPTVSEQSPNVSILIGILPVLVLITVIGFWRMRQ